MIPEFIPFLAVLLLVSFPGVLLSFALLHHIKLGRLEKALIGACIGIIAVPSLSIIEFALLGSSLSVSSIFINIAVICTVSLILLYKQIQLQGIPGHLSFISNSSEKIPKILLDNWALILLVILMGFGFWLRFSTAWSPSFFEFDPYYYDEVTQMLIQQGSIPHHSDMVYFPEIKPHREFPIIHYMTGGWFMLYQSLTGIPFDKELMILIIQLYPPLVASFMILFGFLYVKEEYDKYVALISAALLALIPQLVKKLSSGVSEQQPFGIFAIMFVFSLYALAINKQSLRLGLLAAFSMFVAINGSAHFLIPFMILFVFTLIQALADFFSSHENHKSLIITLMVGAGALLGNFILLLYKGDPFSIFAFYTPTLLLSAGTIVYALLYAIKHYKIPELLHIGKKGAVAVFMLLLLFLLILTPLSASVLGYINNILGLAKAGGAVNKTVQEEAPASEGFYNASYGEALNPPLLVILAMASVVITALLTLVKRFGISFEVNQSLMFFGGAILIALLAVVMKGGLESVFGELLVGGAQEVLILAGIFIVLSQKLKKQYAFAFGMAVISIVVLNKYVDYILQSLSSFLSSSGVPYFARMVQFFIESDIFLYILVSVSSAFIAYHYSERKSRLLLLTVLFVFPVAYMGLSKLKYMVHLALVLAIVVGFVLGEFRKILEELNEMFHFISIEHLKLASLFVIILVGIFVINSEAKTIKQSLDELSYSRISSDWIQTTDWMRTSLSKTDRIISWWDYGHWITFFGETKSVLDPGNNYAAMDQEVAHAFVNGNTAELIQTMHDHQATHILVDAELIPKWGALVFLSGTYNGSKNNFTPGIATFENGPGSQQNGPYETEHYFENIYSVYTPPSDSSQQPQRAQCPGTFPKAMYYSSFGALYCMDQRGNLFLFSQNESEEKPILHPALVPMGGDSSLALSQLGSTGLVFNSRAAFLNLDPDIETPTNGELKSNLINSAFVNLFFFEKLDGFQLVYKSPGNQVKIFKLLR